MKKVKICGLSRPADIEAVNRALPDFCGFIINFPASRRNVSPEKAAELSSLLSPDITPAGVFVNAPVSLPAELSEKGVIKVIQLHGSEDNSYISSLRQLTDCPIWQAFRISSADDISRAISSTADLILLDAGQGTGHTFDWSLLKPLCTEKSRPFALAGGLDLHNINEALKIPAVLYDVSGGVETDGFKDPDKILKFTETVRKENIQL